MSLNKIMSIPENVLVSIYSKNMLIVKIDRIGLGDMVLSLEKKGFQNLRYSVGE